MSFRVQEAFFFLLARGGNVNKQIEADPVLSYMASDEALTQDVTPRSSRNRNQGYDEGEVYAPGRGDRQLTR